MEAGCKWCDDTQSQSYVCPDDYQCSNKTGTLVFTLLIYEVIFTMLSFILSVTALRKKYDFSVKKKQIYLEEDENED